MPVIDQSKERAEPLSQLAKIVFRRFGVKRSWANWYRWTLRGTDKHGKPLGGALRRIDGQRIYLESIVIGGVVHSSVEAYLRFTEKLSEGRE